MDATWEVLDPMGHRRKHQEKHYPRGRSWGIRLPEDYEAPKSRPLPGSY